MTMKSTKYYLLEAMYRWMVDSECTPLIRARTDILGVVVPQGYAENDMIVLDISDGTIEKLEMSEHLVTFNASFGGKVQGIRLPMTSILGIHTAENGMGIEFHEEDDGGRSEFAGKPDLRVL